MSGRSARLDPVRAFAVGGIALVALYVALPDGVLTEALYNGVLVLCTAVLVAGIRRHRPANVLTWWLLAAGFAMLCGAELVWFVNDLRGVDPFPSPADALDIGGRVMLLAAIAALFRVRNRVRDATAIVDTLITGGVAAAIGWVVLLRPFLDTPGLTAADRALAVAYVATDAAVVSGLLLLAAGASRRHTSLHLLIAGTLSITLGDALWIPLQLTGRYAPGGPLDALWPLGFVALAASALHPSMTALTAETAVQSTPSRRRLGALGAVTVAVPLVVVTSEAVGERLLPAELLGLAVVSAAVAALASWRVWGLVQYAGDVVGDREARRYQALARSTKDVVAIIDRDLVVGWLSPSGPRVLGWGDDAVGRPFAELTDPTAWEELEPRLAALLEQQPSATIGLESVLRRGDGSPVEVEAVAQNQLDEPEISGIVVTLREITERRQLQDQLAHQSRHDRLTGLANRAHLVERIGTALVRLRSEGQGAAVFLLDLDDFKSVNEGLGPAVGDEVLMAVAERLRLVLRGTDTIARFGGDEFALLCCDVRSIDTVATADRLVRALERPLVCAGADVTVNASIGVRLLRAEDTAQMVLRDADIALYAAKSAGKARVEVFDPEMGEQVARRLTLRADLRNAWARREMFVVFQPIVAIDTGELRGAEALVRWTHPLYGTVPPTEFIPLAEDTGTISSLGLDILRAACDQAAAWRQDHPAFYISVNVSPVQLVAAGFVERVDEVLAGSRLSPDGLMLEITEGVLLDRFDEAVAVLEAFRARGIRTAIDDFGTGYSSLAYMQQLPVDVLKIDRSFTLQLGPRASGSSVVPTIMDLAGALAVDVVAEGVDDPAHVARLRGLGCRLGQGYLYARPLPASSFGDLFATRLGPEPPAPVPPAGATSRHDPDTPTR
jgi:diguanylate cyclase (GGDEF)-like protein/PAS domain S-box-containing protein